MPGRYSLFDAIISIDTKSILGLELKVKMIDEQNFALNMYYISCNILTVLY